MKQCARCKEVKPRVMFHKNVCQPDGLQAICAECGSIVRKKYYKKAIASEDDYQITYSDIMSLEAHLIKYPARMLDDMNDE